MSSVLFTESKSEIALSRSLEKECREKINALGPAAAALKLGLAITGVESLLFRRDWAVTTAIRVYDALNFENSKSLNEVFKN